MKVFPGPFDMGTGEAHDLVVEARGESLSFSMGGEEVFTDETFTRHDAGFGLRFSRATVAFDNVRITELPQQATSPSEPMNLRVAESGDSATLTWDAPGDPGADADGEEAEVHVYEVSMADDTVAEEDLQWTQVTGYSHEFTDLPGDAEQILRVRAINSLDLTGRAASAFTMHGADPAEGYKLRLENGPWQTSHVQGIAVDPVQEFIYYSFTTLLVKTDFAGNLIGTVGGLTGHLGDLDFNPEDGRVYGSLEYKDEEVFYAAIFDVDQIDRVGIEAQDSDVMSTVYLDEVTQDYIADMDGDGIFDGDTADTADHRYGASGFDGVAFGPEFGSTDGRNLFTLAYGIYENLEREDNDHQVLLQYDVSDWGQFESPLSEADPHTVGPDAVEGKYFAFTGNTRYGVQNLEYDPWLERWFMAVYPGSKPQYPNYEMFAVDAADPPTLETLQGLDGEEGMLLPLAEDGLIDPATGIRGWWKDGSVGFQSLENGLFYISEATSQGGAGAILRLECWTGDAEEPFALVADGECSYAPEFTSPSPAAGQVDEPYEHQLTVRSYPGASFASTGTALPEGLELDTVSGLISGTPTTAGEVTVTVTASNGTEETHSELLLTIEPAMDPDPDPIEPTPEPTEPGPDPGGPGPDDDGSNGPEESSPGGQAESGLPETGIGGGVALIALTLVLGGVAMALLTHRGRARLTD